MIFALASSLALSWAVPAQVPTPPAVSPEEQIPAPAEPARVPESTSLPDAPEPTSVVVLSRLNELQGSQAHVSAFAGASPLWASDPDPGPYRRLQLRRARILNSSQRFLDTTIPVPLTSEQKLFVASTDVIDPFNLITLVGSSAYFVGTTPHSGYGPGFSGFGRHVGYSLSQDVTGEFFATYAIPSLVHEDPRYYRRPGAPVSRRVLHAISHTFVAQHDDGSPMPNYALLGTYPISAVIANLYVPDLHTDARSTAKRVGVGIALDPAAALIDEFLPDVARRVHVRVVFFQQILNNLSATPTAP